MQQALATGNPDAAQIVAAECVVLAETKDHLDWELLGEAAKELRGEDREVVMAAFEKIEDEEDEHLYHTQGWCRELWLRVARHRRGTATARGEARRDRPPPKRSSAKESRQPRH